MTSEKEVKVPAERLSMRKVREVLRLRALGLSPREISKSLGLGRTTVREYLCRAKDADVSWPLPDGWDDQVLEEKLFVTREEQKAKRPLPEWASVHTDLRGKHVTLALLWEEYKTQHPDGYQYSQFCELYRAWAGTLSLWMRQEHRGGDKLFVDFSGDGIPWTHPVTGETHTAQLFVAVLGASSYTFAKAYATQQLPDWISGHVDAYQF